MAKLSHLPINDPGLLSMTPELLDLVEMLHICDDPEKLRRLENVFFDPNYGDVARQAELADREAAESGAEIYTEEDKEKARELLANIQREVRAEIKSPAPNDSNLAEKTVGESGDEPNIFDLPQDEDIPNDFEEVE